MSVRDAAEVIGWLRERGMLMHVETREQDNPGLLDPLTRARLDATREVARLRVELAELRALAWEAGVLLCVERDAHILTAAILASTAEVLTAEPLW